MAKKNVFGNLDYSLLILVTFIVIFGVMMIYSSTFEDGGGLSRQVIVQIASYFIGLVLIGIILLFDYEKVGVLYKGIYIASIMLLLMVYIPGLGIVRGGARSWINLGFIDLQTSEVAKLGYIIAFAKYLEGKEKLTSVFDLVGPAIFAAPFLGLLMIQPDLGSALVYIFITFIMLFIKGLRFRIILLGLIALMIIIPIVVPMLSEHQQERIDAFLDPNDPTLPGNYHVLASKITIGSGGVSGLGYLDGKYHRNDYLPVQETDFIFAVIGEELGFIGGMLLITGYFFLLFKMMRMSFQAKDEYGSLAIVGVVGMFLFQIFQNIGMTIGIMPVTGVTLPFVSYGGSSLITSLMAIGIVMNIHMRRKRKGFMI